MSIKSPCIKICKFDDETGYCKGCFRTKTECKEWKDLKKKKQRKIIDARPDREKELKRAHKG